MKSHQRKLKNLPISEIIEGERARVDFGDLKTLASSIISRGLLHPILVRVAEDGYQLLDGGRRLEVFRQLKEETIPAVVLETDEDYAGEDMLKEYVSNEERKPFNHIETAQLRLRIHETLMQENAEGKRGVIGQWTVSDSALVMGVSLATLRNDLSIAEEAKDLDSGVHATWSRAGAMKIIAEKAKAGDGLVPPEKKIIKRTSRRPTTLFLPISDDLAPSPLLMVKAEEGIAIDPTAETKRTYKDGLKESLHAVPYWAIQEELPLDTYDMVIADISQLVAESSELDYSVFFARISLLLSKKGYFLFWIPGTLRELIYARQDILNTLLQHFPDSEFGVWHKGKFVDRGQPIFHTNYETFFFGRKGNKVAIEPGTGAVLMVADVHRNFKIHPDDKPVELWESIFTTFLTPRSKILSLSCHGGTEIMAGYNCNMVVSGYGSTTEEQEKFNSLVDLSPRFTSYTIWRA